MSFVKTKLWTLDARRGERRPLDGQPEVASARGFTRIFHSADLLAEVPAQAAVEQQPPRVTTEPECPQVGEPAQGPARKTHVGTATRILPIESLMAQVEKVRALELASAERPATVVTDASRTGATRRVVLWSALAVSAALACFSVLSSRSIEQPMQPAVVHAARPAASVDAPPDERVVEVEEEARAPAEPEPLSSESVERRHARSHQRARGTPRDRMQRSAVDAVAAGDYVAAVRAYDSLLVRQPDQLVYAEAARILRARMTGRVR